MITKIKFFLSLTILLILSIKSYSNENIYIVYKVNNEIITNSDIEKEYQYLITLNNQLKTLDKLKALELSKESALREKIKKIELAKYFDLKTLDLNIDNYLQNFYKSLNIKNDSEFKQYLRNNDISFTTLKKKFKLKLYGIS